MKILLIQNYNLAKEMAEAEGFEATVEAEYGENVIEGSKVTLAHHVKKYKNNSPPSVYKHVGKCITGNILISHIDLDTIGGVLELIGEKTPDNRFWEAVGYIDINGVHHLNEIAEIEQDKINAYYAWKQTIKFPNENSKIIDVTVLFFEIKEVLDKILSGDKTLIEEGQCFQRNTADYYERCLFYEDEDVRCFVHEHISTAASYYSPTLCKYVTGTINYSKFTGQIIIAFREEGYDAKTLVKSIWGSEAGGHSGIAGSPRGKQLNESELESVLKVYKKYIKR